MKNLVVSLIACLSFSILVDAQTNYPTFTEISKVADGIASELWGTVYPDKPVPYYSKNEELIGYRINYSINKPFPSKADLIKKCKEAIDKDDHQAQWGVGEFGNIFISARTDLPVINDYSNTLSPEYAMGFKLEKIAKSNIGYDAVLQKVYYIDFANQWFCFSNDSDEVYICIFPKTQIVHRTEFDKIVEPLGFFCSKGDFTDEWNQYLKGEIKLGKAEVWIPNHDGYCMFYDWSYGCTPTAAAMLLSYWDYTSTISSDNYSKLIDYHFQRWDGIEGMEWDYQVPNVSEELAIAMGTNAVGSTDRNDIAPGYAYVCNNINGYNFNCTYHDEGDNYVWYFNKIQDEINAGRPIHISIPDHSECCIAYDASTNLVGVHNTWWPPVQWINRNQLEGVYSIIPGNPHGLAINLNHPVGDTQYNQNGNGEIAMAGDFYEISWNYDYAVNSYIKLYYSLDGGYNWTQITANTPNDGVYDWLLPTGISSSSCRIQSQIWSSGTFSGADGSIGNFTIFPGGFVETLYPGVVDITNLNPDYYLFNHPNQTWCAIGVRCADTGEDWDISMFDDHTFNNIVVSSMNGALDPIDFIVLDGHHTPVQDRGIKVNRFSGNGNGHVQYDGGTGSINMGYNYYSWSPFGVVEMFDVYLTPGEYKFKLNFTSGSSDLDMALYKSNGAPYFANRNDYIAGSFNPVMGTPEEFISSILSSDHYGLCVWNNDNNLADYCIILEKAGTWTGDVDINWHNPANWSAGIVPDASMDVIIPEMTNQPWVYAADAECNSLTIYHGTGANFLKVFDEDLHVHGDLIIHGQLVLDHPAGRLIVDGDVSWELGATASFPYYDEFLVYGDWYFKDGANAQINNGTVQFVGTGGNYIYSDDADCYFNDISCKKTGVGWLSFSYASSQDLNIHGSLFIQPDCLLFGSNPNSIILQEDFNNFGILDCNHGTFVFDGDQQDIFQSITYSASTTFNNLTISSTDHTSNGYDDITVHNHVTIESGYLWTNQTIHVGGNWGNLSGSPGFSGTGTVEFNGGNYDQYCSNETFNALIVNKTAGGLLKINGTQVSCAIYDWTAGGVDVDAGGLFTANDLIDNGIFGTYIISSGGIVNLSNYNGDVDLNGDLYIGDGTMNVYGGIISPSRWPYVDNASITMSDGILDFHDQGIIINDAAPYHLTENITGGTIRTSGSFWGETNEFSPDAGTLELYGNTDASIYLINNCYLHNLIINKISEKKAKNSKMPVTDQRSGKQMGGGSKSNNILMISSLTMNGSLNITTGILNSNGFSIYIGGDWTNNVGDAGFIESSASVYFTGGENATIFSNEIFYNVIVDKKYSGQMLYVAPGITINTNYLNILYGYLIQDNNSQANIAGDLDMFWGYLILNDNSLLSITGNVNMDNGYIDASQGTNTGISIGGNWTDNNNLGGFHTGEETITVNGSSDQIFYAVFQNLIYFNNLTINKTGGTFRPDAIMAIHGDLNILSGDWLDYSAGLNHYFSGDFTIGSSGNYYPGGTTSFSGSNDAYYQNNGGSGFFKGIRISKIFNKTLTLNSDMVVFVDGTTVIQQGNLNLNGHSYKATGNIEIHDGGNLIVDAGANLSMHSHMFVQNGGTYTTAGVSGNKARVYTDGSGDYAIEIELGGTISSEYTTFEDLQPTGLWVHNNAFVDPVNCFNHCSFDGYTNPGGSTWLIIDTDQDLSIDNISFPNNPGGANAHNIGKNENHGHITITNSNGDFSGPAFEYDFHDRIDWVAPETELDIKVFLEGPFNGVDMNTDLNDLNIIPLTQPYNIAPWNYPGSESVASIPNSNIVDWILVEIRDALNAPTAIPATIVDSQAAFILNDGSVVSLDGASNPEFYNVAGDHIFLTIQHRNHLGIMSASPLAESGGISTYDFSAPAGQAYGTDAQKNLSGGMYGMYGGDAIADGNVNTIDKIIWANQTGTYGYKSADFNMNGQIENQDKNDIWVQNIGESSQLPASPWQCGDDLNDTRDGQYYTTVQIGTQCWMAENLNIGTMIVGSINQSQQVPEIIEKYCYNNSTSNCDTYGGLYQWDEMMQYSTTPGVQGICPPGWHLPTDGEWCTLENEVDAGSVSCSAIGWRGTDAGGNIKETGTTHWHNPNIGATNSSGFTALGSGYRNTNGTFGSLTYGAYMWSSNVSGSTAWDRRLWHGYTEVNRYYGSKTLGYSVRCLKD